MEGSRDPEVIFNLIRYCWPLSLKRAQTAEYVLALDRGVVVGAFKPSNWAPARAADFPNIKDKRDEPGRIAAGARRDMAVLRG